MSWTLTSYPISSFSLLFVEVRIKVSQLCSAGRGSAVESLRAMWPCPFYFIFFISLLPRYTLYHLVLFFFKISFRNETLKILIF